MFNKIKAIGSNVWWRMKRHVASGLCRLIMAAGIFAFAIGVSKMIVGPVSEWTAVWVVLMAAGIIVGVVARDSLAGKFDFLPEEE